VTHRGTDSASKVRERLAQAERRGADIRLTSLAPFPQDFDLTPLPRAFYLRPPRAVARDLLGCILVSRSAGASRSRGALPIGEISRSGRTARSDGTLTAGRIVETEAYLGPEDAASHAAIRPLTARALFYGEGGRAYVFRIYGVHYCLNVITGRAGSPGCVLIRALEPVTGMRAMAHRRGLAIGALHLANGPGKLCEALAITSDHNGMDVTRGSLVIAPAPEPPEFRVAVGPRIGITRATALPLRFWIRGNRYVSR
jgi:DNA-3-methyladenine glycosylase